MVGKKGVAVAGAVGRAAPWIVSAAALAWIAPRMLSSGLASLHTQPTEITEPSPSVLLALIVLMCVTALLTGLLRSGKRGSSYQWVLAPVVALLIGLECVIGFNHLTPVRDLVLYPSSWAATVALLLMVVLSADTLRRRSLPIDELTIRMSVAASVMWFCGVASSHLPTFSQPWAFLIDNAACSSAEAFTFRVVAAVTASLCMLSALASRITRRRSINLLPLAGLTAWFTSRAVVDVVGLRVAHGVCVDAITTSSVSSLAATADLVSSVGVVICIGCFGVAAMRETLGNPPKLRSWSVLALVPTLWLLTSPSLEPTFGSTGSQLTWASGNAPGYATDTTDRMTAVLNADGELHIFQSGQHSQPASVDVIAPPPGQEAGIAVLVKEGATFRDLRNATGVLRSFSEIALVWHTNDLHAASVASRRRWPSVETESRALRGQSFRVGRRCSTYHDAPSLLAHCDVGGYQLGATIVSEPDHLELTEWLRASDYVPDPNATLVVPSYRQTDPNWSVAAPERENETVSAVLPEDAAAGLIGLLIAFLAALGLIARELRIARSLTPRANPLAAGSPSAETHPTWVAPEIATLSVPSTKGAPYRGDSQAQVQLATMPASIRELRRVIAKALHRTSEATMRWVFVAVVATALGFALPMLFSL